MPRLALIACGAALALAGAAAAQDFPPGAGSTTRAPRSTARGGVTEETAPAARAKLRAGLRPHRRHTATTRSGEGSTGYGFRAPGGPGAPPPTLPVGPGTAPATTPGTPPG